MPDKARSRLKDARDTVASDSTDVVKTADATATSASDAASTGIRTVSRSDEDKFIRAMIRKFRAVEVDPPPPPATSSSPREGESSRPPRKCALCRRDLGARMVEGGDGRVWCPKSEHDKCSRIAAGRLGASASSAGSHALRGVLEADGKCRDCGAPVKWVKTQRGRKMPVDVEPAPMGPSAFEVVGETDSLAFYVSEKRRRPGFDVYEFHGTTCSRKRHG